MGQTTGGATTNKSRTRTWIILLVMLACLVLVLDPSLLWLSSAGRGGMKDAHHLRSATPAHRATKTIATMADLQPQGGGSRHAEEEEPCPSTTLAAPPSNSSSIQQFARNVAAGAGCSGGPAAFGAQSAKYQSQQRSSTTSSSASNKAITSSSSSSAVPPKLLQQQDPKARMADTAQENNANEQHEESTFKDHDDDDPNSNNKVEKAHLNSILPAAAANEKKDEEEEEEELMVRLERLAAMQEGNPYYCQWNDSNTLEDACQGKLLAAFPSISNAQKWYFIGDSTMARMIQQVKSTSRSKRWWKILNKGHLKQHPEYYGFDDGLLGGQTPELRLEQGLVVANNTLGEGPYPPDHPSLLCVTCGNEHLWYIGDDDGGAPSGDINTTTLLDVEFLAMEFARDRTFQLVNRTSTTSQETMSRYMARQQQQQQPTNNSSNSSSMLVVKKEETVCVANTGMHELYIKPLKSGQLYAKHVIEFQDLMLERHCDVFLWISINQVADKDEKKPRPQTKERVLEYNTALQQQMLLLQQEGRRRRAFYLDAYPKSKTCPHPDHVHMDPITYYKPLAWFFFRLMSGTQEQQNLFLDDKK